METVTKFNPTFLSSIGSQRGSQAIMHKPRLVVKDDLVAFVDENRVIIEFVII